MNKEKKDIVSGNKNHYSYFPLIVPDLSNEHLILSDFFYTFAI